MIFQVRCGVNPVLFDDLFFIDNNTSVILGSTLFIVAQVPEKNTLSKYPDNGRS
jgi:hypothetical protein